MSADFEQVRSIFLAVLELPADAWDAHLARACGGDAAVREQVELLLRAHDDGAGILDRLVREGVPTTAQQPREQPGAVIAGRYKLLEPIGEGGMGAVWVAEQTAPVRRKVALKLIKTGMDSRPVIARFEAERQALAVMDHPNIAKVLDGGLTEAGRPYFVMEYVKGVSITDYCDKARLSVAQRLDLFAQVCQAVQHAHQKGIIHRDLKPSNILVAPYDDRPVPKVIDFGLAKAMHQPLTELTLHTAHEAVLGTPLYMSPEQAQLNNIDVDTRSDIYSLGVLLYELLTGSTPLEKQRFREAAWEEVRRIIREEEPPRPSTRLSSAQTLASLAAGRQIEPQRLTRMVRGELDWIVMKALEKDRNRRYETASGLAMDVRRYLAGDAVLAAPPTVRYRLSKFARKHRAGIATATAILLLLIAGVAVSAWQAVRATHAEADAVTSKGLEAQRANGERLANQEAQAQRVKAEQSAAAANAANDRAQKRLAQVQKASDILGSIFGSLDPKEIARADRPLQAILVDKLDQVAGQLDGDAIGDPMVMSVVQTKLGHSLLALGAPAKALVLLERAHATVRSLRKPEDHDTLASADSLATAYKGVGRFDLALPLYERTLKVREATLGLNHPDTILSLNNLAVEYQDLGKLDLALPLYEQTLGLKKANLGPDHSDTYIGMSNLATAYEDAGRRDLALPLFKETLERRRATLGPAHPDTLQSMGHLAHEYSEMDRLDLAIPLYDESLRLEREKLGSDHPTTLGSINNLAATYWRAKRLDKAIPLFEEALRGRAARLGREHPDTLTSIANLGQNYLSAGRVAEAIPLLEEVHRAARKQPRFAWVSVPLHECYEKAGRVEDAAVLSRELIGSAGQPNDRQRAAQLMLSALAPFEAGDFAKAEPLLRDSLAINEKAAPGLWTNFMTRSMLGASLAGQRRYAEAEPLLVSGYEGMLARAAGMPPKQAEFVIGAALERLIAFYSSRDAEGDREKAGTYRKRLDKLQAAELVPQAQPTIKGPSTRP